MKCFEVLFFYILFFYYFIDYKYIFNVNDLNIINICMLFLIILIILMFFCYLPKSKKESEFLLLGSFQKIGIIFLFSYYFLAVISIIILLGQVCMQTCPKSIIIDVFSIGFLIKNPILNIKEYIINSSLFDLTLKKRFSCLLNIIIIYILLFKNNAYIIIKSLNFTESIFYFFWILSLFIFLFNLIFFFYNIKFLKCNLILDKNKYLGNIFDSFTAFFIFACLITSRFIYKSTSLALKGYLINNEFFITVTQIKFSLFVLISFTMCILLWIYLLKKTKLFAINYTYNLFFFIYIFLIFISLIILRPIIYDLFQLLPKENYLFFYELLKLNIIYIF